MSEYSAKFPNERPRKVWSLPFIAVPLSFLLIELFAFVLMFLRLDGFELRQLWPMAFGFLWSILFCSIIRMFPRKVARILYGILYFLVAIYAIVQTGYYVMFSKMMWLSEFRYASEGANYFDALFSYPKKWWLGVGILMVLGVGILWKFPKWETSKGNCIFAGLLVSAAAMGCFLLPQAVFLSDPNVAFENSEYGRSQSAEAAYENMFSTYRLYQICGIYQTCAKDIYEHHIFPLTPSYAIAHAQAEQEIDTYFEQQNQNSDNSMTGLLEGKNIVMVLMESMDDWMIGEYTPTLEKLMSEGINFTQFYTPVYGGIRTFNSEFCINTGSFLSSQGGYAFDYVTNHYDQSLASLLSKRGYSAELFHYNDDTFYSRGVFSEALGYEKYVGYGAYVEMQNEEAEDLLCDDQLLFDNESLNAEFFREGAPTLNFVITRSAHLSYKYNDVLSNWGLKKYPEFRGLTGNEETDCALLKAKLVDDLFARMLTELEVQGQLENTVIIGVADHYTYGYMDIDSLLELSGVEEELLLEKTPCFIWSADIEHKEVDKVLNTSDLLPTMLNLLGVESEYDYIGNDAFDDSYEGFVSFSDGGWISGDVAYDASTEKLISISGKQQNVSAEFQKEMEEKVSEFIRINNLILETDYYQ